MLYYMYAYCYAKENNYQIINSYLNVSHSTPYYETFNILNTQHQYQLTNYEETAIFKKFKRHEWFKFVKPYRLQILPTTSSTSLIFPKTDTIISSPKIDIKKQTALYTKYRQELINNYLTQSSINKSYNLNQPNRLNIVIHIRRGDVHKIKTEQPKRFQRLNYHRRYLDDNYFINVINHLHQQFQIHQTKHLPKQPIFRIFTEGSPDILDKIKTHIKSLNYEAEYYIEPNSNRYNIENSKKNTTKAINNMKYLMNTCINADIFIMSKSQLSFFLGVYNTNLVITPKWTISLKMENWHYYYNATRINESLQVALYSDQKCVQNSSKD